MIMDPYWKTLSDIIDKMEQDVIGLRQATADLLTEHEEAMRKIAEDAQKRREDKKK